MGCIGWAGKHGTYGRPAGKPSQASGKGYNAVLARGVGGGTGIAGEVSEAGEKDPPCPAVHHTEAYEHSGKNKGCQEIDLDHGALSRVRQLDGRPNRRDSGAQNYRTNHRPLAGKLSASILELANNGLHPVLREK